MAFDRGLAGELREIARRTMSANRIESFSDGVLAIVITIMVLSLHRPQGTSFGALRGTTPSLLAYALSFIYVAIY
ncbi:MAG: TMEM175 family protein [Acidimicrobiales bacterium]